MAAVGERPNIIFILADQHRADALGCMGGASVISPNIDSLANEGVTFTRSYCNSPLCKPARAALQTGQHVCQNGVWTNQNTIDPQSPSYVRNIRQAGYHTSVIGKTHLWSPHDVGISKHTADYTGILREWGFDHSHEITGPIMATYIDSPYTDALAKNGSLEAFRKYQYDYLIHNHALKMEESIGPSLIEAADRYGIEIQYDRKGPWITPPWPLSPEEHYDSYVGRKAIEWINGYAGDQPFYLMVGFPGPHDPFDSPEEYRKMYSDAWMPRSIPGVPSEPMPEYLRHSKRMSGLDGVDEEYLTKLKVAYYAGVTLIDDYVGKIVSALRDRDMLEHTWIIYSSDHGEMLGDHGLVHKSTFYEGAVRIPTIIRPAQGCLPWHCDGLTDQLDLAATMVDIAEGEALDECVGRSLKTQILKGNDHPDAQSGKSRIFSEFDGLVMVLIGRYKLVVDVEAHLPLHLFDLADDPNELTDLVDSDAIGTVRDDLLAIVDEHLAHELDKDKWDAFQEKANQLNLLDVSGPG